MHRLMWAIILASISMVTVVREATPVPPPHSEIRWFQNCLYFEDIPEVPEHLRGTKANMCDREYWDI